MSDEGLPEQILYGELQAGARRSVGGQKKGFKDTLKTSLKDFNTDHTSRGTFALNRTAWRNAVGAGAISTMNKASRLLRKNVILEKGMHATFQLMISIQICSCAM